MTINTVSIYRFASPENELVVTTDGTDEFAPIAWIDIIREALAFYDVGTRFPLGAWNYGEIVAVSSSAI